MVVTCDFLPPINWVRIPESLPAGGVVLVRVQVSSIKKQAHYLFPLLHPDEVARAKKYHKQEDYYCFLVARASLRILVGRYADKHPTEINFALGINKKPLATNASGLHYNISHCRDWVLIALAGVEVGIDVEIVDQSFPFKDILAHSFSPQEQAFITQSSTSRPAFFQAWTRKEAFVKATAQGIDTDFSSMPALDGRHYLAHSGSSPATDWAISSFEAAPNYVAAIARPIAVPLSSLCFCEAEEALFSPFCMG